MIEERIREAATLDGNKLVGLVAPTYDGSAGTEYDLFQDGTTFERFAPGCWDDCLKTNPDIKCYAHHDRKQILGRTPKTLSLSVEPRGLMYANDLPETQAGKDTKVSVGREDCVGASVGMKNVKANWTREGKRDIRTIVKADLDHIAIVNDPAYTSTSASLRDNERERLTEERQKYETEKWTAYIDTLTAKSVQRK